MALDEFQQNAVESDSKYVQVVGYSGSGKTIVLAHRIARLIEQGVAPSSIVALTFTNSACLSLQRSIAAILRPDLAELADRVRVNTFHSFCREIIEQHPIEAGITSEWQLVDFVDTHNIEAYQKAQRARSQPNHETTSQEQLLSEFKTYSFDRAIRLGIQIAQSNDLHIRHIIVDEFQDTTKSQWELIRAILKSSSETSLLVAGDPHQEIYNFQDDHLPEAFTEMRRIYKSTDTYFLKYNYRATPKIIEAFQKIIGKDKISTNLIPTQIGGREATYRVFETPEEELEAVITQIKGLVTAGKYTYDDIAVLVRQNSQGEKLAKILNDNEVPARHDFGIRSLGNRKLTSLAITLLKWGLTSKDFYLMQLLFNRYHYFVREEDLTKLLSWKRVNDISLTDALKKIDPKRYDVPFINVFLPQLRDDLLHCTSPREIGPILDSALTNWKTAAGARARALTDADKAAWSTLMHSLDQCAEEVEAEWSQIEQQEPSNVNIEQDGETHLNIESFAGSSMLEDWPVTAYEDGVGPMDSATIPSVASLEPSQAMTAQAAAAAPPPPPQPAPGAVLDSVLRNLMVQDKTALLAVRDGKVAISTIHSAKSNEWPVVFIPSVPKVPGFRRAPSPADRRVLYVGASRAKQELYISYSGRQGVSEFLNLVQTDRIGPRPPVGIEQAMAMDPLVFKPIKAIKRISRLVKL